MLGHLVMTCLLLVYAEAHIGKNLGNKDPKPTIGMKSKISINFRKKEAISHEKSPQEITNTLDKDTEQNTVIERPAKRSKQILKKSHPAKKHLEAKKRSPVAKAAEKSKELVKPKKRTSDSLKMSNLVATIADLSGAGSGEMDTDILSGDSRSNVESGDDEDDDKDSEEPIGEGKKVHGDPELVDITLKELADAATIKKGSEKEGDKKSVSDDEAELDDIKIEELLNPKPDAPKEKKKKATKEKEKSVAYKEGKISLVLQQNFNSQYQELDTPRYQILAGNIKKDIEKMIAGTTVNDITFSEVSVEGTPRQTGKTKANFNIKAPSSQWMKKLLTLVDSGDIDGLRVIKGSLEIEEQ